MLTDKSRLFRQGAWKYDKRATLKMYLVIKLPKANRLDTISSGWHIQAPLRKQHEAFKFFSRHFLVFISKERFITWFSLLTRLTRPSRQRWPGETSLFPKLSCIVLLPLFQNKHRWNTHWKASKILPKWNILVRAVDFFVEVLLAAEGILFIRHQREPHSLEK